MLLAAFAALVLQQTPSGAVVWQAAAPPEPADTASALSPSPALPDWAVADPFAWERSQCSSLIRRQEGLAACQTRVRADLAAHLGEAMPDSLRPAGLEGECVPTDGADGYVVSCAPPRRELAAAVTPQERICETRPQRQPNGGVTWAETCRPSSQRPGERDGLTFKLFERD